MTAWMGGRRRNERASTVDVVPGLEVTELWPKDGAGREEAVVERAEETGEEFEDWERSRVSIVSEVDRERSMSASCMRPAR